MIMTNALLGLNTSTKPPIDGPEFACPSTNNFGTLPNAVASGGVITTTNGFQFANNASGEWIAITTHPYLYLVGSYDGQNGGTEVWLVGDFSGRHDLHPEVHVSDGDPRRTGQHRQLGQSVSGHGF